LVGEGESHTISFLFQTSQMNYLLPFSQTLFRTESLLMQSIWPRRMPGTCDGLFASSAPVELTWRFVHRVVGLVAKIGGSPLTYSMSQDLREAILAFRHCGKTTVAFADSFGEFTAALPQYWLASFVLSLASAFPLRMCFSL
jgi:hypothetical protein